MNGSNMARIPDIAIAYCLHLEYTSKHDTGNGSGLEIRVSGAKCPQSSQNGRCHNNWLHHEVQGVWPMVLGTLEV